jgi:membrane protease YdiL (CAAX protease family)
VLRLQLRRLRLRLVQLLRPRSRWFGRNVRFLVLGLGFGLLVLAAMVGLYEALWKTGELFAGAGQEIRGKIVDLGIDRLWIYAAVGVFYAVCHSGLEEYYWRWFVFGQLRYRLRPASALAVSSVAFMAHHVILLATYFGWSSPWTYAFSLAVAVGGAVWAWLYQRSGSLAGPWLSHLVVDAAIFLVGYDVARDLLA